MIRIVADRLEEARLRESLEYWQVQLHLNPQSEATKFGIKDLRSQLQKKEDGWRCGLEPGG